jgi:hypothetical protein
LRHSTSLIVACWPPEPALRPGIRSAASPPPASGSDKTRTHGPRRISGSAAGSSPTRETPRESGFRLALSGFSIKTASAISICLRLRFDPSSSAPARFLRTPVLPFARRPFPVRSEPEGSNWTPPHLAAVRRDSSGSGRPRRPLASSSEERGANPGSRPKPVTRRSVRSFASEVALRCAGGPEGPSSGSLSRPKPFERVRTYGRTTHSVNRFGWSLFACLSDFSRSSKTGELHGCGSCHTRAV